MACYQVTRVNILLDFKQSVVIVLSPEAVDVIWLVGISFIDVSATVGSDFAQWIHQFASISEALGEKFRGMWGLVIGIPSRLHHNMPDSLSLFTQKVSKS